MPLICSVSRTYFERTSSHAPATARSTSEALVSEASNSTSNSPARSSIRTEMMLARSEEHTSELQSRGHLVCRLLLEKKKNPNRRQQTQSRMTDIMPTDSSSATFDSKYC